MTSPLLSLVTITKDDPVGLARTLASGARLRAAGAEHLVVDGSAVVDESPATIAGAEGVRWMARPARGVADAFNTGIAAARGEWVWCLNGGDHVDPRLSASVLLDLLARTQADLLIGGLTYEGEATPRPHPPAQLRWPPVRSWIPHPATLVRRSLFERFGGFDEQYAIAMDYEWWLRVIPTGVGVDVLSVPFAVFAPGGMSQRPEMLPRIQREQRRALRRHFGSSLRAWADVSGRAWKLWARALVTRPGRKG